MSLLIFSFSPLTDIVVQKMEFTITVPKDISVQRGFCAHVPCSFTVPKRFMASSQPFYIYWFKIMNKQYYLFWVNVWVMGHLMLTGNPDKGDCSFSIIYAGPQDAGRYYLRIDKGEGRYRHDFISSKHKSYSEVQVIITDLKKPNIEKPSNVIRGQPVTLSCVVPDTCSWKPPEITWPKEEKPSATSRWSRQHSQWSWSHGVNMTFIPSLAEENASLTCHVRFPATRKTIQDTVHLTFARYGAVSVLAVWVATMPQSLLQSRMVLLDLSRL
uniref:Ig-like domain-containing protein n=1 Tax=Salvator merianae TaxID=96440 RepID=A0A8D0BCT0_SALMN